MEVFSHSNTNLTLPSGQTITANANQVTLNLTNQVNVKKFMISTSAIHNYDQVIVRGARAGCVFTVAPTFNFNEDWSSSEEDDYNTALGAGNEDEEQASANADYRARDELHNVFSHWLLPTDWDGKGVRISDETEPIAAFTIDDDGDTDVTTVATIWQPGLRFSDFVPLKAQVDYTGTIEPGDDDGVSTEFLAPIVAYQVPDDSASGSGSGSGSSGLRWIYSERVDAAADSGDLAREHTWTIQTRVRPDKAGLVLEVVGGQQHYLAADRFIANGEFEEIPGGELNLGDFVATVYLPLQQHVFARYPAAPSSGDLARTMVIDVKDAYLDRLVPGSVVGVDSQGELQETEGGWVRDDRERLKDIAAIAWQWYGTPRLTVVVQKKGFETDFAVGQLITEIETGADTIDVNTAVTSLTVDLQAGTTTIETHYSELDFQGLI